MNSSNANDFCNCDPATECPLGKTGLERCTNEELAAAVAAAAALVIGAEPKEVRVFYAYEDLLHWMNNERPPPQ